MTVPAFFRSKFFDSLLSHGSKVERLTYLTLPTVVPQSITQLSKGPTDINSFFLCAYNTPKSHSYFYIKPLFMQLLFVQLYSSPVGLLFSKIVIMSGPLRALLHVFQYQRMCMDAYERVYSSNFPVIFRDFLKRGGVRRG